MRYDVTVGRKTLGALSVWKRNGTFSLPNTKWCHTASPVARTANGSTLFAQISMNISPRSSRRTRASLNAVSLCASPFALKSASISAYDCVTPARSSSNTLASDVGSGGSGRDGGTITGNCA